MAGERGGRNTSTGLTPDPSAMNPAEKMTQLLVLVTRLHQDFEKMSGQIEALTAAMEKGPTSLLSKMATLEGEVKSLATTNDERRDEIKLLRELNAEMQTKLQAQEHKTDLMWKIMSAAIGLILIGVLSALLYTVVNRPQGQVKSISEVHSGTKL